MTLQEKSLYHQVHPLKLGTDITAQVLAIVLFWEHSFIAGLGVMIVPPIVASAIMISTQRLDWIKDSAVGRYLRRSMTHAMEAVRLAGTVPMVVGAWYHMPWLIALGLLIVLFGWLRGLIVPERAKTDALSTLP
jgi:hypothetical protein